TTLAVGSTYFIRMQTVDNLLKDDSDKFSIIVPTITVTAPTTGTTWVKNATKTIIWNKLGTQDANVKIQLYMSTTNKLNISLSAPNNGSFDWLIPPTLANGTYTIRITTLDGKVQGVSKGFAIAAGMIKVTAPTAGAKWFRGMAYDIAWTSEGTVNANVKIQLYKGTTLVKTMAATTPNDGSFEWTIPATQALAANYKVRVTTVDNLVQGNSGVFAIASSVGLKLTAPNGNELLKPVETQTIRWSQDPDILEVKLEFSRDNGGTYATIADHVPDTGSYDWLVPINFTRNGIIRVSDASGRPWINEGMLEYKFKFNYAGEGTEPGVELWFGSKDPKAPSYEFSRIEIGNETVGFGDFAKAILPLAGSWHELRVRLDLRRDSAEIRLDDQLLFENAPLGTTREHYFQPFLVLQTGGTTPLEFTMDDLAINVIQLDSAGAEELRFNALSENFDRYDGQANALETCWQWLNPADKKSSVELGQDGVAGKALKLRTEAGKQLLIWLPFSLPDKVPFDISDKCFMIEQ
ncbi:MAG TPA: Ser-Thr-rich GPI-anchored membrane family protein, partial [Acidobacteriota bacterium]